MKGSLAVSPRPFSDLMDEMNPSSQDLERLKEKILLDRGYDFRKYRDGCFQRRVTRALRNRGAADAESYMRILDEDPEEYRNLLHILTISHTSFFRNLRVYQATRDRVLPAIVRDKKRSESRLFRVWSAGCATGEEPYSLAMILSECLKREDGMKAQVTATDIDAVSIEKARAGAYPAQVASQVPEPYRSTYLFPKGSCVEVCPELRKMVGFKMHDLVNDAPLKGVDLIYCRNVLIYFRRDVQEKVLERLHSSLSPGGYLVLGMVESLVGETEKSLVRSVNRDRIFSKIS